MLAACGSRSCQNVALGTSGMCLLPARVTSIGRSCIQGRRSCKRVGSYGVPLRSRHVCAKSGDGFSSNDDKARLEELTAENAVLRQLMGETLAQMSDSERASFLASHKEIADFGIFKVNEPVTSGPHGLDSAGQAPTPTPNDTPLVSPEISSVEENTDGSITFSFDESETAADDPFRIEHFRSHDESDYGFTGSGPSGRFHMGVYSFSTSTIEEAGGSGSKKQKNEGVDKDGKEEGVKEGEEQGEKVVGEVEGEVEEAEKINMADEEATEKGSIEQPSTDDVEVVTSQGIVDSHDPQKSAKDKSHWLYFMVPKTPVAGADVCLYFNKASSDALRYRQRVELYVGFNAWELEAETSTMGLEPAPVSRDDGSEWWRIKFPVPRESYEMNFIFSDGEGNYDNNYGQDFLSSVRGRMTKELWEEASVARAAAAFEAREEAEKTAAAEAEKKHQEQMMKQDLEKAEWRAGELKSKFKEIQSGAIDPSTIEVGTSLWKITYLDRGSRSTLSYNFKKGPLAFLNFSGNDAPTLKGGFNGWNGSFEKVMRRASTETSQEDDGDDWWEADVDTPVDAFVFNFVINFYEHFDNNKGKDYKVLVGNPGMPSDAWFEDLVGIYRNEEKAARIAEEKRIAEQNARREKVRRAAKEKTMAVARKQIKHVLFTKPQVVKAGESVELFYSSNDTCLNGKEQIYMIGGWNRWTHKKPFGPLKMTPPEKNGVHWKAKVNVPMDAYKMDFVFSDVSGGEGTYDNRGGYDYHLPVEGGVTEDNSLHIVHIAVEMAPIAKVGGLGDVVTALGRAVKEQGHLVEVLIPRYEFFQASPILKDMVYETEFEWGGTRVYVTTQLVEGLRVFFIEPRNGFFQTQSVYGRYDDGMRFEFFCKAAMEFLLQTDRQPDILHCHDWSTADVAKAYWNDYNQYGLWKPKVVFTIHNMNYGQERIAAAAFHSQKFTTVSPTYALEVGGNPIISPHVGKFTGIRNGIDIDIWDPEVDQFLPMGYTAENVVEGKAAARRALAERFNLAGGRDVPMIGVISRLTGQKGVHLIKHAAWRTVDRGGLFVLLGSAPDPKIQAEFDALAGAMNGDNAAFCFAYDEPLSHLIYAACDMVLLPSMFEPCGLTQLIAMRYGTIPVVRATGGLHDTVFDVDNDKARAAWELEGSSDWKRDKVDETNGFSFEGTDPSALDFALNRAVDAFYNDREWFRSLQKRVMLQDWSWNRPALDYIELYYAALKE